MSLKSETAPAPRQETYDTILAVLPITEAPIIAAVVYFSAHRWASLVLGALFPLCAALTFRFSQRRRVNLERPMMLLFAVNLGLFCWVSGPQAPAWLEGLIYLTALTYLVQDERWKRGYGVLAIATAIGASVEAGKPLHEVAGIGLALGAYAAILMRTLRVVMRQNEEIEDLLLNIFPRSIVEELKSRKAVQSVLHPSATVLFTDFKGFTAAAERLSAADLVTELDACFSRFDAIIGRHHLEKLKTIGDSYMCAGGIPEANATHPIDCCLAALAIREEMRSIQAERTRAGQPTWDLRIGIHTGPLVAGVIGKKRFAYDIWGDTVNTASRMESSGQPGEINVSAELFAQVREWFACEHRGRVSAKGKGELDMYFVRGLLPELAEDPAGTRPNAEFHRRYAERAGARQT